MARRQGISALKTVKFVVMPDDGFYCRKLQDRVVFNACEL